MKVVHIATDFSSGGASKAAYRISKALQSVGVDSTMLVRWSKDTAPDVSAIQLDRSSINSQLDQDLSQIQKHFIQGNRTNGWNTYYSLGYPGVDISNHPMVLAADVINLHWVSGFMSPVTIKKLTDLGKPVVWTMHDERPFAGGAHYTFKREQFKNPEVGDDQLSEDPFGLSRLNMIDQKELFKAENLVLLSPSEWLAEQAKSSHVVKEKRVEVIANAHDIKTFYPRYKTDCRKEFGIPADAKVILFAAHNPNERRKGFLEAKLMLEKMLRKPEISKLLKEEKLYLLVIGSASSAAKQLPVPVVETGLIKDENRLARAYSCADLMVFPTLAENFSNMMCEVMACGIPVVGFDIGGNKDAIQDGVNGFLIEKQDTSALAEAVSKLTLDSDLATKFSQNAAKWVEQNLNFDTIGQKYKSLYQELVSEFGVGVRGKNLKSSPMDYTFGHNLGQKISEISAYTQTKYSEQINQSRPGKVSEMNSGLKKVVPHPMKRLLKKLFRR